VGFHAVTGIALLFSCNTLQIMLNSVRSGGYTFVDVSKEWIASVAVVE
jgi:hypothetical protein